MIGHTLGAAGAIEAVVSVLAIHDRFIPPTIHHQAPDPQCDLDYVPGGGPRIGTRASCSPTPSPSAGNNTSVVFGRFSEPAEALDA